MEGRSLSFATSLKTLSLVCVSVCLPVFLSSEKWFSLTNDLHHNNHFLCLGADRCLSQRSSTVATSYSLLHLEYHPISPSNLNHTGPFLMKRSKRDLENSGEGPRGSVLMDINNLEIESLCTKLSLGIKLVD